MIGGLRTPLPLPELFTMEAERQGERHPGIYRTALLVCAVFHGLHFLALPLVMSPDGLEYVALSERFGASGFFEQWSYIRMPLYPLLLRASFDAFGKVPGAALLPGVTLGFLGVCALAAEVRRIRGDRAAAVLLALLSAYPVLVGYEHTVLTEPGTFCILSLVVVLLSRLARRGIDVATMGLLGCTLAAGYLFRATTIAVLPAVTLTVTAIARRSTVGNRQARLVTAAALMLAVGLPLMTMKFWRAGGRDARIGSTFGFTLSYYVAAQGLLPATTADLGEAAAAYEQATEDAAARRTSLLGIAPVVASRLQRVDGKRLLREAARTAPLAYTAAVARTALTFAGTPQRPSENALFLSNVLSLSAPGSKCVCPEADQAAFTRLFARPGFRTPLHYALKIVTPLYVPLVLAGSVLTLIGFAVGVRRGDPALLALTSVPVAFSAAHAFLLLGTDRFAMPVLPFALVNVVVFASVIVRSGHEATTGLVKPAAAVGAEIRAV